MAVGLTAGIAHNLISSTEVLKSGSRATAAPSSVMKHAHHAALQASAETVVHTALGTKDPGEGDKAS